MKNIPVISFVANSGTGKTTLIEKIVRELKSRNFRVAVIKHDAHDFEIDREGKDSWRHAQAGADVVAIVSATKAAVMEYRPVAFEDVVANITNVDLIITEGYRTGDYPKIAIRRAESGRDFKVAPENCVAVVSDTPVEADVPAFGLEDVSAIADFLVARYINILM